MDIPCSGTGTLRKNPELKWRLRPEELERLKNEGTALALAAAGSVAEGGLLVLIACSIETDEVLVPLERVLSAQPDFAPLELGSYPELFVQRGLRAQPGLWQIFPEGDHDGFSVAVARRR